MSVAKITNIVAAMRANPKAIRFDDLCKVCDAFLVSLVNQALAIGYTKHHGEEIRE